MKIQLDGVQETLLIPLAAKAVESKKKNGKIKDAAAEELVSKIEFDFSKFERTMSEKGVIARTIILDRELGKYFTENSDTTCISIGCGLDTRLSRLRCKHVEWYNLDFPDVISLRKKLMYEGKNVHYIAKSALDMSWTDDIPEYAGQVVVILEGILMYFTEMEVIQLITMLHNRFRDCVIFAEIMHPFIATQTKHHDTVKKMNATFKWGIKSGCDMERICNGLTCVNEWNITDELKDQGLLFYLMCKIPFIYNKNNKIVELHLHNEKVSFPTNEIQHSRCNKEGVYGRDIYKVRNK